MEPREGYVFENNALGPMPTSEISAKTNSSVIVNPLPGEIEKAVIVFTELFLRVIENSFGPVSALMTDNASVRLVICKGAFCCGAERSPRRVENPSNETSRTVEKQKSERRMMVLRG